jgi:hypothetical protein
MYRNFWWNHTRKPNKFAKQKKVAEQFFVDSDELQHLDECDSEWVEAWKVAANQLIELEAHVSQPAEKQKRLVEIKKSSKRALW